MHLRGQIDFADEVVGWQVSRTCPCKWPLCRRGCHSTAVTPTVGVPQWDLGRCRADESASGLHLVQAGSSQNKDENPGEVKQNPRGGVMNGAWGLEQPHRGYLRRSHLMAPRALWA